MSIITSTGRFIKSQSKLAVGLGLGLAIGGMGTAAVMAGVPDSNGVIHACYKTGLMNKGQVRIIDSPSQSCSSSEAAVSWNSATTGQFVANLVGADFTNTSIAYRNFSGADLHGTTFDNTAFNGSDFSGANLASSIIKNSTGGDILMNRANFSGADFSGVTFSGTMRVFNTTFDNANFNNVSASFVAFYNTASFKNVTFDGAHLDTVDFTNGDLTNVHFKNSYLVNSDLRSADLTGVTWQNTTCPDGSNSDNNGNTCIGHLEWQ